MTAAAVEPEELELERQPGQRKRPISADRVASRRRADLALRLRGEGLTFEEIAAFPDADGRPLYPRRSAAFQACEAARRRCAPP